MNYRWFYILLANVAVLGANIWLFIDKPQPEPIVETRGKVTENVKVVRIIQPTVAATPTPAEPLLKLGSEVDLGHASVESFHFPFIEPLPSKNLALQSLLEQEQATVKEKNNEIKKEQQKQDQQLQQLVLLENRNKVLQEKLLLLERELTSHETLLTEQRKKINSLEKVNNSSLAFETKVDTVKHSINSKPDLIKSKVVKEEQVKPTVKTNEPLIDRVDEGKFSGSVEFGFLYEQDNQITKAVNGRLVLAYEKADKYKIDSDLDFEFENEDGEKSTDKYRWQLQSDYNLDPANLVYARSDINRSQFSSYEREDIFTVGYGRIFLNTKKHKFNTELGPGYRFSIPNIGEDAVSIDEFIIRARLNYERVLTDNLQIAMDTVVEAGHENSIYSLSFKAQNRIYQELYLVFNFDYKFTQNVPVDTVNKEVSSGLSLLYAF